jgi:hypothetical protein
MCIAAKDFFGGKERRKIMVSSSTWLGQHVEVL